VSRPVGAALASHIATGTTERCRMLLFVLRDGTKHGITDADVDIDFDLPEEPGEITYSCSSGFRISDVEQPMNLDPGSYEVTGPIGDIVTLEQLLGGRWRRATTYLFEVRLPQIVNFVVQMPTAAADMMKGIVTKTGPVGGQFKFEVQDERHKLSQIVGRTITNQCPRNFAQCCVEIAPETMTTVDSVTSASVITVDAAITGADFINGRLWFTDGPLAGTDPVEIFAVSGSTITLFEPLPALPDVGDAVTLKEGCDGIITTCRDRFDNAINHRGFAAVPGSKALQPAIPGQGDDGSA
jgi:uncharacterized phage protein (TIGR02218 family)